MRRGARSEQLRDHAHRDALTALAQHDPPERATICVRLDRYLVLELKDDHSCRLGGQAARRAPVGARASALVHPRDDALERRGARGAVYVQLERLSGRQRSAWCERTQLHLEHSRERHWSQRIAEHIPGRDRHELVGRAEGRDAMVARDDALNGRPPAVERFYRERLARGEKQQPIAERDGT